MAFSVDDASLQGAAISLCVLVIHFSLAGQDVTTFVGWLSEKWSSKQDPWEERLESAMSESRKHGFFLFTRVVVFCQAGGISYWARSFYLNPCLQESVLFLATFILYLPFMAIATRSVHVTTQRVDGCCSLMYGLLMVAYLAVPSIDGVHMDGGVINVQLTGQRFAIAAVVMDTRKSAPWQVLLFFGQIWADFCGQSGLRHPAYSVFLHLVVLTLVLVGSAILENCVRSNIRPRFDCSDAESLMFSFRRMLRGVCDGEVLLDSTFRIHSVSDCLKHLLMTSTNLHGQCFEKFLEPEAVAKFRDLIKASTSQQALPEKISTPPCLRISLLGAANTKVSLDVIHVPIPNLYGSQEFYHLLALKEDSGAREEEVEARVADSECVGQLLQMKQLAHANRKSPASEDSATSAASGLPGLLPSVVEVNLLVDTSTEACDVRQVNLRIARPARGEPSPQTSLRSMVLPTDWVTIQAKLLQYADRQEEASEALQTEQLSALRCRVLERSSSSKYSVAQVVEIFPHKSAVYGIHGAKLWLRLADLVEGSRSRGPLAGRLGQIREVRKSRPRRTPQEP